MKIIDVKETLGEIEWNKVSGNVDGAMIRAGIGRRRDDRFEENVKRCAAQNIPFGAYWLSIATTAEEAAEEARKLLKATEGLQLRYPLAIQYDTYSIRSAEERDIPITAADASAVVRSFCKTVTEAGKPAIYATTLRIQMDYLRGMEDELGVWMMAFRVKADLKRPIFPCDMWCWGYRRIPGIAKDVAVSEVYNVRTTTQPKKEPPAPTAKMDAVTWAIVNRITTDDRTDHALTLGEALELLRRYHLAFGPDEDNTNEEMEETT